MNLAQALERMAYWQNNPGQANAMGYVPTWYQSFTNELLGGPDRPADPDSMDTWQQLIAGNFDNSAAYNQLRTGAQETRDVGYNYYKSLEPNNPRFADDFRPGARPVATPYTEPAQPTLLPGVPGDQPSTGPVYGPSPPPNNVLLNPPRRVPVREVIRRLQSDNIGGGGQSANNSNMRSRGNVGSF